MRQEKYSMTLRRVSPENTYHGHPWVLSLNCDGEKIAITMTGAQKLQYEEELSKLGKDLLGSIA